ncbi:pyridoxal phosphate-dependent transferase [Tricharina praecox]|uniref:pyridoxal phosphate-dependent transferase n=1 Tax=Tricharina praecox TaxID=43433 RepID=UPI0022203EA7|nr:pyridoxal phosphate-dependent transferase [Tricharina praecox]KAI5852392.1 pyridoxal phosphate-dependent transferase [Tricharina praecox]
MPQHPRITCNTGHATGSSADSGRKPADLTHHFNASTRARKPSVMKGLYKYFMVPGMSNIAGGLPYPGFFPYDTLRADVASPERLLDIAFHGLTPAKASSSFFSRRRREKDPKTSHISIPKFEPSQPAEKRIDVATTLQYGRATGLPALADFVREFTFAHMMQGQLAYAEDQADIVLTCGSTDGFSKIVQCFGTAGDSMLVEEFTYPNALQTAAPFGISTAPVRMDEGGMMVDGPGGLRDVLENWNVEKSGRRPHLMYTVTIGQNPTGITLKRQRRKEIYELCDRFDVLILEDDPYWHLQFTPESHNLPSDTETKYPFLAALELSFLSIDTSGRVIRLDTFSKTIAPGCRMGWITAQKPIIAAIVAATESSTQQPSGFVQGMVAELLCRAWGMDGWVAWLESLRDVYEERMVSMTAILEEGKEIITVTSRDDLEVVERTQLYSFNKPEGGMFVWIRMDVSSHPAYKAFISRGNSKADMLTKLWEWNAVTQLALPCPGGMFTGGEKCRDKADDYFRFCFAAIELEEVKAATSRWVQGTEKFWHLKAWEIEKIGEAESVIGTGANKRGQDGGWGGWIGGKGRFEVKFEDF